MTREDVLRDADEASRRFAAQLVSRERAQIKPKPPEIETTQIELKSLPISFGLKRN